MISALRRLPSGIGTYSIAILAFLLPGYLFTLIDNYQVASYFSDFCFVLYTLIALYYFVRAMLVTRKYRPELFPAWLLMTTAAVAILGAVGSWVYVEVILGGQGNATTGASFLILSHILLGSGIYCLPQQRQDRLRTIGQMIDVLIILIGCSLLLWALWLYPTLQASDLDLQALWTGSIFMLADLMLIAALGSLLFRQQLLQPWRPILMLSLAILAMLFADAWLSIRLDIFGYQPGGLVDHLNLASVILSVLSAKFQIESMLNPHPPLYRSKRLATAIGALRSVLPPLLLFVTFVVMVVTHDAVNPYNFYVMAIGIGVMFILVSVHQVLALMENVDLTNALRQELFERRQAETELQQANETLEQHVVERTKELVIANKQLRESEQKLRYDAFHDKLTGLPNRTAFIHHVEGALHAFRTDPTYRFAVLFLDFDSFKVVNDSLGHWLGDEFLIALARRLKEEIPIGNLAARLGGDEFVVLVENILNEQEVLDIANHLQQRLRQPYEIRDYRLYTTASIGVVMNDDFHQTAGDLLRDADIAMYQAKENGKARCIVFDAKMRKQAIARLKLENALRNALTHEELHLAYQPIWNVISQTVTGFEALARWQHKEHGYILPADFIPVAEETGLIIPLGEWVMEEACRQLKVWQGQFTYAQPLTVSVNISAHQLYQGNLVSVVQRTLQKTGLSAASLKLEITESVFMEDIEAAIATCSQLRDLGVCLQIDDFGTGYSSFNYLHRLPINTMKIDKSFIDLILLGGQHVEIVRTIATLAQNLQLSVIAEGVETEEQLQFIAALGCEQVQGYLISKPLDRTAAEKFITATPVAPHAPVKIAPTARARAPHYSYQPTPVTALS